MRREFSLPDNDVQYLETTGLEWETIVDHSNAQWLLLKNWKVKTPGYNHTSVCLALLLPPSYPDAQIDMVYFHPALLRVDGRSIGALADQIIEDQVFQRWSRHRTPEFAWRPDVDEVATHLVLVDDWLQREMEKS